MDYKLVFPSEVPKHPRRPYKHTFAFEVLPILKQNEDKEIIAFEFEKKETANNRLHSLKRNNETNSIRSFLRRANTVYATKKEAKE